MQILIVSHSYIVEENRKNITRLSAYNDVVAAIPSWVHDRVLGRLVSHRGDGIKIFKRIALPRVQFLLGTFDLGMSKLPPDIIHIEYDPWAPIFWQTYLYKAIFARKARVVCTVKKNTFRKLPKPMIFIKKSVSQFFIRRVDHFFAVNHGVREIYKTHFNVRDNKITLLQHLGVDMGVFKPSNISRVSADNAKTIIGYCGRLDAHKGVEDLIEAMSQLVASGKKVTLRLLGNGTLKTELQNLNYDWIEFVASVPHHEVPDFMQSLDVFVMPARITPDHEEHDGHALMEAMACGVACIGTNSGVILELLSGEAGCIVTQRDIDALSGAIDNLADDKILRKQFADNARLKAIREFSVEAIAKKKIEIYKKVLSHEL